jgi:hypothetical protein
MAGQIEKGKREGERARRFFGPLFRAVRFIVRPFFRIADLPDPHPSPCVYVCRHKNMQGPVGIALNFRDEYRFWSLSTFFDRKSCFQQYYGYTFVERYGWPRPVAYVVARLGSVVVPAFIHSLRAIPVYRGSASVIKTYRQSIAALLRGERIMIFPDVDYQSEGDENVRFYEGFLLLDKYYQAKTGAPLPFVPLYVDAARKRILKGAPVTFLAGERDHISATGDVSKKLIGAIDALSASE